MVRGVETPGERFANPQTALFRGHGICSGTRIAIPAVAVQTYTMPATKQNVTNYVEGDSLIIEIPVRNPDGSVQPIGGASIEWVLATERGGQVLIEKSTDPGGGIELTNPDNGVFRVTISGAETAGLYNDQNHVYWHEAVVTDVNGLVQHTTVGEIPILESTT